MEYKVSQVNPDIGKKEIEYVTDTLKRKWITEGKYSNLFLDKIQEYTGAEYAVLAPNGTLAIYMALQSLGLSEGDKVIVPDFTFNATASVLPFLGAEPIFCDINPLTFQMDVDKLEELATRQDVKAIIPVHLFGQSVDMDMVMYIADEEELFVMEDAAQGLGVFYSGTQHVGTFGDAGIFAFFADKNIIMGEGGVVVTDNKHTYENLLYLRNQGRIKSGAFVHETIGMNFKITDMQCAVGFAQMERIDEILRNRTVVYNWYKNNLSEEIKNGSVTLMDIQNSNHVPLRMPVIVKDKTMVKEHLEKNRIQIRDMSLPLHRNPCWEYLGYRENAFPNANKVYDSGLLLPIHNKLTKFDVEYVCSKIKEVV